MDSAESLDKQRNILNKEMLQDIIEKTNKIHASFLFLDVTGKLLQQITRILCATAPSTHYNSWVDLGMELGLDRNVVKTIEYTQTIPQDPVYVLLLVYSQNENSTIANIYVALTQLERNDVICQTHALVMEFHRTILQQFTIPSDGILRPPTIPEVPHIFQNFQLQVKQDKKDDVKKVQTNKKKYQKCVLLTYLPTKKKGIVEKVVEEFRKDINGQSIGVLMFDEHRKDVFKDQNLVQIFYKSANYIIIILTTDYLDHIAMGTNNFDSIDNLDGYYATYIYNTMIFDYLKGDCKNRKVRCIIPDDEYENVQKHHFFQPLFQAWTKEENIAKMAEHILHGEI